MPYKKEYPVASAKTSKELASAYAKAKTEAKKFGFATSTALKEDVVAKAMTEGKKPAEFSVRIEEKVKDQYFVDFVCDVKGKMSSVLGRKQIKTVDDFKNAEALAKDAHMKKWKEDAFG